MSFINAWLAHPLAEAIGWTLLHFLWQGTAVAAVLAVGLAILKRRSAQGRYLLACGALMAMVLLPACTLAWCWPSPSAVAEQVAFNADATVEKIELANGLSLQSAEIAPVDPSEHLSAPAFHSDTHAAAAIEPMTIPRSFDLARLWLSCREFLHPLIPWLVCGWFAGALMLSLRLLTIWIGVERLCRVDISPVPEEARLQLMRLARQLKIARPVRLLQSTLVEVPTVIGWLAPVILLPASALVGLAPVQLEAILIHELAHIRRWDYLVNLVQNAIETLLFYHPAVWWVSGKIRQERENCCDDLAASLCGDRVSYAEALVRMEELRAPAGRMALAASGGNLLLRVRRLLGAHEPDRLPPWWQSGVTALIVLACLGVACREITSTVAAPDAPVAELPAFRVLEFPEDRSLGVLYRYDGTESQPIQGDKNWTRLGDAQRSLRLPAKSLLRLDVNRGGAADLSPLARLPADALYSLQINGVDATDNALLVLKNLTGLRSIDLSYNAFTDAGLKTLAGFKDLWELYLMRTEATDTTAALLAELPNLRYLQLSNTKLTNTGLAHIGRMSQLELLGIDGIKADDAGLAELEGLSKLHWLSIRDMPITDIGMRSVAKLAQLKKIQMMRTLVTSASLPEIAKLKKLQSLRIEENNLKDDGLEELATLPVLESLHLGCRITDLGLAALGRMASLKSLHISGSFGDAGLAHLAELPQLEELNIYGGAKTIGNAGARHLARSRSLKRLWLQSGKIDDDGLQALAGLPLEMLLLSGVDATWESLANLRSLDRLKKLSISESLGGKPTLSFLEGFPTLEELTLPESKFDADDWSHVARLAELRDLQVWGPIDDAGAAHLAKSGSLRTLHLYNASISDAGMQELSRLKTLETLQVRGKCSFTDQGLEHLTGLRSLTSLYVYSDRLTEEGVSAFAKRMPQLRGFETPFEEKSGNRVPVVSMVGQPAPDFSVTTLDGKPFRLSEHRGKTVVVHFWATWCAPCMASLPRLKEIQAEFAKHDDVVFISLSSDIDEAAWKRVVAQREMNWRQAFQTADEAIGADYHALGVPHYFVVDRKGMIAADPRLKHLREEILKVAEPAIIPKPAAKAGDGDPQSAKTIVGDAREELDPISGSVVDSKGTPVAGARVVLRTRGRSFLSLTSEPSPGRDLAETISDARGAFEFHGVAVPINPQRPAALRERWTQQLDAVPVDSQRPAVLHGIWMQQLDVVALSERHAVGWLHLEREAGNEVVLAPPVSLRGRVVGADGQSIAGAEVRLKHLMTIRDITQANLREGQWPRKDDRNYVNLAGSTATRIGVKTDANGQFTLEGLPAGLGAYLEVDHPDYLVEKLWGTTSPVTFSDDDRATFRRPVQSGEIAANLDRGHHLKIRVVSEETGEPVGGAQCLFPPYSRRLGEVADQQGRLDYRQVPSGYHDMLIYGPDGSDRLAMSAHFEFTDGVYEHEAVVKLPRGVRIGGRVVDAQTGRGIAGVHFYAHTYNNEWLPQSKPPGSKDNPRYSAVNWGTTDENGSFRIAVIPGKATVSLSRPWSVGGYETSSQSSQTIDVPNPPPGGNAESAVKELVFKLARASRRTGRVIDPEGKPVAQVEIIRHVNRTGGLFDFPDWMQRTDAEGGFMLPYMVNPIQESTTQLTTFCFRHHTRRLGGIMTLDPSQPIPNPLDVRLVPMRTVTGRVVDAITGKPIRGAQLWLRGADLGLADDAAYHVVAPAVQSGADGRFSIPSLIPSAGKHYVDAYASGYASFNGPRTQFVAADKDHDVGDLRLERRLKR
jgi:beta-lactamase regulating signal transducer with metallopeptidase domain/thiol-disulfide isomerase/thioredoxin